MAQVEDEARGGGEFENLHIKFKREAEKQKKAGAAAGGCVEMLAQAMAPLCCCCCRNSMHAS